MLSSDVVVAPVVHVKLKKLVDECIVDHSLRTQPAAESSEHFLPVTGILLGTECDGEIKVSNSFPVDFSWDMSSINVFISAYSGNRQRVGWYTTAERIGPEERRIHELVTNQQGGGLLIIKPLVNLGNEGPTQAYVYDVKEDNFVISPIEFFDTDVDAVERDREVKVEESIRLALLSVANFAGKNRWKADPSFNEITAGIIGGGNQIERKWLCIDTDEWGILRRQVNKPNMLPDGLISLLQFHRRRGKIGTASNIATQRMDVQYYWQDNTKLRHEFGLVAEAVNDLVSAENFYVGASVDIDDAYEKMLAVTPRVNRMHTLALKSIHELRLLWDRIPRSHPTLMNYLRKQYFLRVSETIVMEGSRMTPEQCKEALALAEGDDRIPGRTPKEVKEAKDIADAFTVLSTVQFGNVQAFDKEKLCEIHAHVLRRSHLQDLERSTGPMPLEEPGAFRKRGVAIGMIIAPPSDRVEILINQFFNLFSEDLSSLQTIDAVELAALAHFWIVMIHPFRDGNGRTCRLIYDYILTAMGYPPVIVATDDQTRSSYYNALCLGETNNRGGWIRPFILFMFEQVRRAIQGLINVSLPDLCLTNPSFVDQFLCSDALYAQLCRRAHPTEALPLATREVATKISFLLMKTQQGMAGTSASSSSMGVHIGFVSTALALADGRSGIAIFAGDFAIELIPLRTKCQATNINYIFVPTAYAIKECLRNQKEARLTMVVFVERREGYSDEYDALTLSLSHNKCGDALDSEKEDQSGVDVGSKPTKRMKFCED